MTSLQLYMDRALELAKGYITNSHTETSQLAALLQDAVSIDEPKVLAVANTVKYAGEFNELVRDNVKSTRVDDRYNDITQRFDSIREDSRALVDQLADGKIDWKESVQNWVMKIRRGTPHRRFEQIRDIFVDVTKDTAEALKREQAILNAYQNFRLALKGAETLAYEVFERQTQVRDGALTAYQAAAQAVTDFSGLQSEKSKLELARDEKLIAYQGEEKRFQLVKDVAENLKVGYNVGETLVAKLQQTHELKEQVHRRAVIFFQTNEHVFTTMDAVYTSQHGLHETTQTVKAMQEGANKGLEDIAAISGNLERAAIEAGYGATINASSVQKLVDAIVSFQTESVRMIAEARERATQNAGEVERIVNDGKQKYKKALETFVAPAAEIQA